MTKNKKDKFVKIDDMIKGMNILSKNNISSINPKDNFKLPEFKDHYTPLLNILEDRLKELKKPQNNSFFSFLKIASYNKNKNFIEKEIKEIKKIIASNKEDYISKENMKTIKTHVNLISKESWLDFEGIKREWNDKRKADKTFMVHMQLRNGMFTHFMVVLSHKWFDYEEGRYIIDDNFKYYDISSRIYWLDYHQDCCLPLKHTIDVKQIAKELQQSDFIDTETSIDPENLKIFMESDIIQKIMKGAEMEEWIKFIKIMLIINLCFSAIIMIILITIMFRK